MNGPGSAQSRGGDITSRLRYWQKGVLGGEELQRCLWKFLWHQQTLGLIPRNNPGSEYSFLNLAAGCLMKNASLWTEAIKSAVFVFLPPTPLCAENTWLQECSRRDFFPPLAYTVNGRAPSLNKQCGWWLLCEAHVKDAIIFLLCSALNHVKLAWLPHITSSLLQTITYRVSFPNFAGKKITINSPSFKCLIVYKVHWPH